MPLPAYTVLSLVCDSVQVQTRQLYQSTKLTFTQHIQQPPLAMASTSPSRAPATTSSSAWSRLVQITRVASNNSRPQPAKSPKTSAKVVSTPSHTSSPARPAKRRRLADSTPTQCATDNPSLPASRSTEAHALSTQCHDLQVFYPAAGHADCTTACPCQVEDVECVAPLLRHRRKTDAMTPGADLRTLWASQEDDDSLARQTHGKPASLQPGEASLYPHQHAPTTQLLDSPTRSCDSVSEAGSSDCGDIPGPQLQQGTTTPSQGGSMQEQSIHDIGAIFAPRRRQMSSGMEQPTHRDVSRGPPALAIDHGRNGKSRDASFEQEEGQEAQKTLPTTDKPLTTPTKPSKCGSPHADGAATKTDPTSETRDAPAMAAVRQAPQLDGIGLQDGDKNSTNKTPNAPRRRRIRSTSLGDANQLMTPSTSPMSKPDVGPDENKDEEAAAHKPSLATKTKRRLNLHSSSYNGQPSQKKRKTPPKRQSAVQTTLSLHIGAGAGMKECKECDTVYNPFHPEDVKVHAKRHAVVLKNGAK